MDINIIFKYAVVVEQIHVKMPRAKNKNIQQLGLADPLNSY